MWDGVEMFSKITWGNAVGENGFVLSPSPAHLDVELQVLLHAVDVVEDVVHDAGDYAFRKFFKKQSFPKKNHFFEITK